MGMSLTQGQRKSLWFLALLACSTWLCYMGPLDGQGYSYLVMGAFTVAVGGNAYEHFVKAKEVSAP